MQIELKPDPYIAAWILGAVWGAVVTYQFTSSQRPKVDIIVEDPALLE
jgi:hypothetical protein